MLVSPWRHRTDIPTFRLISAFSHEFDLVLGEGARLANKRFLSAAVKAGYDTNLFLLDHPRIEEWRKLRSAKLGKAQNPGWVKGARTRAHNLAEDPPSGVKSFKGNPAQVMAAIREVLRRNV